MSRDVLLTDGWGYQHVTCRGIDLVMGFVSPASTPSQGRIRRGIEILAGRVSEWRQGRMRSTRGITIWLVATRTAWRISTTPFEIQGSAPSLPPLAARAGTAGSYDRYHCARPDRAHPNLTSVGDHAVDAYCRQYQREHSAAGDHNSFVSEGGHASAVHRGGSGRTRPCDPVSARHARPSAG